MREWTGRGIANRVVPQYTRAPPRLGEHHPAAEGSGGPMLWDRGGRPYKCIWHPPICITKKSFCPPTETATEFFSGYKLWQI